jgi:hypothetical protein
MNRLCRLTKRTADRFQSTGTKTRAVKIGYLVGDTNRDGVVNVGNTVQVRNHAGETVGSSNFQYDLNLDGAINVGDTVIVRSLSGTALP